MVHVILDVDALSFGSFFQKGEGLVVYRGVPPFQRGYGGIISRRIRGDGVGSVVRRVWKMILPLLKKAGVAVGKEGAATGGRILTDVAATNRPFKETVVTESAEGMKNLLEKAKGGVEGVKNLVDTAKDKLVQSGSGMRKRRIGHKSERGVGARRKRRFSLKNSGDNLHIGGIVPQSALIKKRARRDTFGFY